MNSSRYNYHIDLHLNLSKTAILTEWKVFLDFHHFEKYSFFQML